MQGKVKWFSADKGYGYLVGDDAKDYYFTVREVQGVSLPRNGDSVSFEASENKKGPRAKAVVITEKGSPTGSSRDNHKIDDRVICPHCGKRMVPRMVIRNGQPSKSLCPFCGGTFTDFNAFPCFIATAVYGDAYAPEVIALRRFRDETLAPKAWGQAFITLYYRHSPPVATFLARRPTLAKGVKVFLDVLARRNG